MARKTTRFDINSAPRAMRRVWVKNARRAYVHNTGELMTVNEAFNSWNVADCGPQVWAKVISRNGIVCAG